MLTVDVLASSALAGSVFTVDIVGDGHLQPAVDTVEATRNPDAIRGIHPPRDGAVVSGADMF